VNFSKEDSEDKNTNAVRKANNTGWSGPKGPRGNYMVGACEKGNQNIVRLHCTETESFEDPLIGEECGYCPKKRLKSQNPPVLDREMTEQGQNNCLSILRSVNRKDGTPSPARNRKSEKGRQTFSKTWLESTDSKPHFNVGSTRKRLERVQPPQPKSSEREW